MPIKDPLRKNHHQWPKGWFESLGRNSTELIEQSSDLTIIYRIMRREHSKPRKPKGNKNKMKGMREPKLRFIHNAKQKRKNGGSSPPKTKRVVL